MDVWEEVEEEWMRKVGIAMKSDKPLSGPDGSRDTDTQLLRCGSLEHSSYDTSSICA